MLLRRIFKSRLQAAIAIIALIYILSVSLQSIFFGADREILYKYSTSVFLCLKNDSTCSYISKLKLANTGIETINNISVGFSDMPKSIKSSLRLRNLNAGKPRDNNPTLENMQLNNGDSIKINKLSPGTLLVIKFSGDVPVAERSLLAHLKINVESDASIINADPQGTELFRLWSMFF